MEYNQLRAMEKTHVCVQCGGEPVTVWDGDNECHRLACGNDQTHNGFQRRLTPQTAFQRGELDKVAGKGAQAIIEKRAKDTMIAFSNLPKQDAGDFSALTMEKVQGLIEWAESIGLNAYLGHVELYHGLPRISVDGYYYLNNKREKPYRVGAPPMTITDKISYSVDTEDYGSIARAWLDGEQLPEIGIGIVRAHELTDMAKGKESQKRYPVVAEHPQRMAEKRAEWQLLRKLIPLEAKV